MYEKVTPLKAWLKKTKTKQADMYEKLGICGGTFSSIACGHKEPTAWTAFKIERLTKGEIQAEDLYKGLREELKETETNMPMIEITPLKAWLKKTKTKQIDAHKRLGICRATLHKIATGDHEPAARTAFRIERLTKGEIQAEDLYKGLREELKTMEKD